MPKANKAGGSSSAWERAVETVEHEAEKLVGELRGEHGPELVQLEADGAVVAKDAIQAAEAVVVKPAAPAVEPAPAPVAAPVAPEPAAAPAPAQSAPTAPPKGSAA